jgi:hypothetical protein
MNTDAVFWGSVITVVITVVILVYLGFKAKQLMDRDARSHK